MIFLPASHTATPHTVSSLKFTQNPVGEKGLKFQGQNKDIFLMALVFIKVGHAKSRFIPDFPLSFFPNQFSVFSYSV